MSKSYSRSRPMRGLAAVMTSAAIGSIVVAISVNAAERFNAYAPPLKFGEEVVVANHLGAISLEISAEAVGDTAIVGEVIYFKHKDDAKPTSKKFHKDVSIRTGDCVASVKVRFKGVVTGSAVKVVVK